MKVPLSWLSNYVATDWSPERIAERLTMAGLEVGKVEQIGSFWEGVTVALVTDVQPHPNADRLRLVTVNYGSGINTVVCGAPNVATGQKVVYAQLGAKLIDGHTGEPATLKAAKIRGIRSEGMVCSEKELGLSDDHTGTIELPADAPIGMDAREYMGQTILDLELTPNRPDCLCVAGVAREVASLTGSELVLPDVDYVEEETPVEALAKVTIEDPIGCPRYCATVVRDLKLGPSPEWMQARLKAAGMRPISNVVDITNYVMLELGQPLHAFDYDRVANHEIVVRRAAELQVFKTLDGVEWTLNSDVLMIADGAGDVAIAGVMGGSGTEISDTTTSILLEGANFNQASVHRTSTFLGLATEASLRLGKGLHPDHAYVAIRRATQLLVELCGGKAAKGVYDAYPTRSAPIVIDLPHGEILRLTNVDVLEKQARGILENLGFTWRGADVESASYEVPYWRPNVTIPADLVEEVIRTIGYDTIPVGPPRFSSATVSVPADVWRFKAILRGLMVGVGFQEILTYSLTSRDRLAQLFPGTPLEQEPVAVANPMSREQAHLRTSLRGSLLDVMARNRRREQTPVRIFELSRIYLPQGDDLPDEREILCALMWGAAEPLSWLHADRRMDFYDAKGVVESLAQRCGIKDVQFIPADDAGLLQGRQAYVMANGEKLGILGQIHPVVARTFEVEPDTFVIELYAGKLTELYSEVSDYEPLSRFPFSERDLAIVVDKTVTYEQVADIISGFGLVSSCTLFDVYGGEQIPADKKSFAIRLVLQAPDRTLTESEINEVQNKILARLEKAVGASLRS
ncbi:phenylalanine--tRNA ligase subunit beta [Chloroflexota bacterium]